MIIEPHPRVSLVLTLRRSGQLPLLAGHRPQNRRGLVVI